MRTILIHCNGSAFCGPRRPPPLSRPVIRCDARHALLVEYVALALDVRVFGRVTQLVIPCDSSWVTQGYTL